MVNEWVNLKGAGFDANCGDLQLGESPYFAWVQSTDLVFGMHSWQDHVGEVLADQAVFIYFFMFSFP